MNWDLASFIANRVLFRGIQLPIYRYILSSEEIVVNQRAFNLVLTARILMSTLSNLDLALAGHGDLAFANRQLEFAEPLIIQIIS
jgi:hypothetical protein